MNMGLKQKFIEEEKIKPYDVDDKFLQQLRELPIKKSVPIAILMDFNADSLPELDGWTQAVGGVIKTQPAIFFEIEYLKQEDETPLFMSIQETDADDYLDHMLNKTILIEDETIRTDYKF